MRLWRLDTKSQRLNNKHSYVWIRVYVYKYIYKLGFVNVVYIVVLRVYGEKCQVTAQLSMMRNQEKGQLCGKTLL